MALGKVVLCYLCCFKSSHVKLLWSMDKAQTKVTFACIYLKMWHIGDVNHHI